MNTLDMFDPYYTPPKRLVRHSAPATSHSAALLVDSRSWEERMHSWIIDRGTRGGTPKEALPAFPDVPYSTITARFAALKRKLLIYPNGQRRLGSAVLVVS